MKIPPLAWGAAAGLLTLLVLAPATGDALGKLAAARAQQARLAALAAAPLANHALVAPGLTAGADPALLAARLRDRAHDAGVLVEQLDLSPTGGALVTVRLSASGSEKAVVALADAVERDAILVRFRTWRIAPIAGGVRLTGEALAVRR